MLNCIWGQHPTCPITHLNDVGHPEVDSALCRVPSASWLGSGSLERAQPTTAWGPPAKPTVSLQHCPLLTNFLGDRQDPPGL